MTVSASRLPRRPYISMVLPDHDSRPIPGLREGLAAIDDECRLWMLAGARPVFRAALAWDHADPVEVHRSLGLAVSEVARALGLQELEVRRLTVNAERRAREDAQRWNLG